MVGTKHCCWGGCKSDSRYPDKLDDSLKEMINSGQKAFIPFPKPHLVGLEKCQRWINACSRETFSVQNINRSTYICALHWPGKKGPTKEHPDPFKAFNFRQRGEAKETKRKAPVQSSNKLDNSKKLKTTREQSVKSRYNATPEMKPKHDNCIQGNGENNQHVTIIDQGNCLKTDTKIPTDVTVELPANIEHIVVNIEPKAQEDTPRVLSSLSLDMIALNSNHMKHFTGLSSTSFEVLYKFINGVCPLREINYWGIKTNGDPVEADEEVLRPLSIWSHKEQLFMCLIRLKTGLSFKTMSILLSTPCRSISVWSLRNIFATFIQLIYKILRDMEFVMFPSKETLTRFLPKAFKTIPRIRCSLNCIKFRVEMLSNFARHANTVKQTNTYKCLIAVTQNGGACFVSDLFEGDISDSEIFRESGILKHIEPHDVILADKGFKVQELLDPYQPEVGIPTQSSSPDTKEVLMRENTRANVERFNQRLKEFKLVGRKIPLSLAPLATQMIVVACGLVNLKMFSTSNYEMYF